MIAIFISNLLPFSSIIIFITFILVKLSTTHKITYYKVAFKKCQTLNKYCKQDFNKLTKTKTDSPNTTPTCMYKHCIDQPWDCTNGLCNSIEQSHYRNFVGPQNLLPYSQQQASCPCPRRDKTSPRPLILFLKDHF
jgi:hypothetical protein